MTRTTVCTHCRSNARRSLAWKLVGIAVAGVILIAIGERCHASSSAYARFLLKAQSALASAEVSDLKKGLFAQALAHQPEPFNALVVHYHPRESGRGYRRWTGTATGTLVRPGVASCTVAHKREWMGAWIWFGGLGVHHVEDNFPESSARCMFDVASPEAYPGQPYPEWLDDLTRVRFARNVNQRRVAILLKPRGGWEQ